MSMKEPTGEQPGEPSGQGPERNAGEATVGSAGSTGEPTTGERIVLRPRTVRYAAYGIAIVVMVASIITALTIPGFSLANRLGFPLFGLAIAWFCHREASVAVIAEADKLTVRNLFVTTELEWPQVIGVSFPAGDPWAHLDLADGDTLKVMAVQRSDGQRGLRDAHRLAALVRERGEAHGIE